jgi:hypothetical protein
MSTGFPFDPNVSYDSFGPFVIKISFIQQLIKLSQGTAGDLYFCVTFCLLISGDVSYGSCKYRPTPRDRDRVTLISEGRGEYRNLPGNVRPKKDMVSVT